MPVVADVQGRDIGQLPAPSSLQGLSMVVHASGCVSLLLYVLLYEVACKPQGSSARLLPDNFSSLALACSSRNQIVARAVCVSRVGGDHLIRRSGQVVQDRPSPVVGWADIPELSTCVGRAFPPVLVALRAQSRLGLEGRTRTLSGPSPKLTSSESVLRCRCGHRLARHQVPFILSYP